MSIPKFKEIVEVEWQHNDFTMQAEVTASYLVRTRACIADEDSTLEKCQWLEDKTVHDLRNAVHESVMEEAHKLPAMEFGYWRCSECGCECFEGARYCMGCGRKLVDA